MLTITDINYGQYKKVFGVINAWMREVSLQQSPQLASNESWLNADPMAVLERWESQNMDRAKRGLKLGLMDVITSFQDASDQQRTEIDMRLRENELPGLYELLNHAWDITDKVLEKKRIRNLIEYYSIQEQVSRIDSGLNDEELKILGEAVSNFEKSKTRKK
jgi:hypothetical protein